MEGRISNRCYVKACSGSGVHHLRNVLIHPSVGIRDVAKTFTPIVGTRNGAPTFTPIVSTKRCSNFYSTITFITAPSIPFEVAFN